MARNPWKKLFSNVQLVATRHHGYGFFGESDIQPRTVSITPNDLRQQFHLQNRKCFWLGIDIYPMDVFRTDRYPLAPSVDRIDNNKGYELGNFVITSRFANLARGSTSFEDFKKIMNYINNPYNAKAYEFFDFV